jgi:hypothetical protein
MDMEKLFEHLVAKMDANQEKAEADRKTDKEETRTNQATMEAGHKELLAKMEADRKADQERMEAH